MRIVARLRKRGRSLNEGRQRSDTLTWFQTALRAGSALLCLRMLLALKVDVDTLRGTREGVPRLLDILRRHGAGATFLFSVGPDHTGRAIRRVFRPGFIGKVQRTSVVRHYGLPTLLYGTLLPGPDIGRRAGDI